MILLVWILCSASVTLVTEAVVCAPSKPNLASYGTYCVNGFQCQTNFCTGSRCSCPSSTYYHSCSYSCVTNCNTTISSSYGFLVSPNYPNDYKNNENCYWTIYGASGHVISFTITDYNLESCCDTINVYDGAAQISPLIGAISLNNNSFVTRASSMRIVFKTDHSVIRTGFNGTFQTHACTTTTYSTYGNIMSPGYPAWSMRYGSCNWTIIGASLDNFIVISFHEYDFGPCSTSNVTVVGSMNNVIYRSICYSNYNTFNVNATTNNVTIRYSASKVSTSYKGFNATYLIFSLSKGWSCKLTDQCKASLTCLNGVCDCISPEIFDTFTGRCTPRKSYGSQCTSGTCETYLTCLSGICNCSSYDYYHDSTTKSCRTKLSYNSICSIYSGNNQCQSNLVCINSRCMCQSSQYYEAVSNLCRNRKSYGSFCSSSELCETYLSCVSGICNCSSASYYHDSTTKSCKAKLSYNSVCNMFSNENQCQSNLACVNSRCTCSNLQYYVIELNLCRNRTSYNRTCSIDSCVTYLTCLSGVCQCSSNHYHDDAGKSCRPKNSFGGNCSNQIQCLGNVNCINNQCACTSLQFHDPVSISCQNKLESKALCNTSIDGICRGPNLQCLPDVRVTSRCLCKEDMYEYLGSCLSLQEIKVSWPNAGRRTTDTIELRWTPNRNGAIVAYQVIAATLGSPKEVRRYDARDYGVNLTGLQPGREYNITIVTVTSRDDFYSSRSVGLEYVTETAPPVPGQIDASQSTFSHSPYRLNFQEPSGYVYKYKIVLSDGESTSTYPSNASEITLTDLKSGTLYFYSVTAYNKQGDYSEAVVGSFKTGSQGDTDHLAVIIGPSVAGVILIILIPLSVVVIRRRRRGAAKPSVDSKVVKTSAPGVERVQLARPNPYRNVPKVVAPIPRKKPVILEVNHDYEDYGTLQNELASLDATDSSTDDAIGATSSVTSVYNNGSFVVDDTDDSVAFKDDENVYQNTKFNVNVEK